MAIQRTDTKKWDIEEITDFKDKEKELAIYEITIEHKKTKTCFKYVGQVYNQTIYQRYLQHIGRNGTIRNVIDILGGVENVNIKLRCLASFKHRDRQKLNYKELALINKLQAESLLLKRKRVIVINTQMNKKEVIKIVLDSLLKNS